MIFLGSKPVGYACFAELLAQKDVLNVTITGLMTQARKEFGGDHDLKALAAEHGIPVFDSLDELPECDIIYSVQYHEILKAEHIAKAGQIAVNLHMAPLPEYRGSNQFSYAIIENKTEFGTTIHRIDTRIDHGDILFQKRFPIPEGCYIGELYQLTFEASVQLFKDSLGKIVAGDYQPVPQAALEGDYGTALHFRNEINALKQIDLNWDKATIERHIRATMMPGFEPPYCIINGEKLYFSKEYK